MNDGAFQTANFEHLTSTQKREYLQTLLESGKEAAQLFLDESEESGWLTALPVEMKASILRFMLKGDGQWIATTEDINIIKGCLNCEAGDFAQCLKDGRQKLNPLIQPHESLSQ